MHRIVTAVGLLVLMSLPVLAQKEFEPTAAERQTIDDCIDNAAGDSELKQMSQCIGLIADPCVDEPGAKLSPSSPAICASRRFGMRS